MRLPAGLVVSSLALVALAGCLSSGDDGPAPPETKADEPPFLGYLPAEPDLSLALEELDLFAKGADGVDIHARIVKPDGPGPFPVVVQFTPYTAPGENVHANNGRHLAEPIVCEEAPGSAACGETAFVHHFVRRGYAFAFADVRGTGDSSGCLDLRGERDIDDSARLIEMLGTASWSSGAVGYIGASYPGSEAHMAGLAAAKHAVPYLKAIVPIVASTSFYHYHHNDGVPYNGNHALGGTNTGYTQNAIMPTVNPQSGNYATRYPEEAQCPYNENMLDHGGLDQTGAYYGWWQERNLRGRAATVEVPVLMAQGLADWNVKPDHIATWFNDLQAPKTLIAGQWGHSYPRSLSKDCDTFTTSSASSSLPLGPLASGGTVCDPAVPYGDWWEYVTAFFDTHLKGEATGMFGTHVAWVQDNEGTWHRSAHWPPLPDERDGIVLHLASDRSLLPAAPAETGSLSWKACGRDQMNMGQAALAAVEQVTMPDCHAEGANTGIVFESQPLEQDVWVSGVPLVELTLQSTAERTHLVAVLDVVDADGRVLDHAVSYADGARQNYGYLNPEYRHGLEKPEAIPKGEAYGVTIDLYPQEDVLRAGQKIRLTIRSIDEGRTIEAFPQGENTILLGSDNANRLVLPLRPAALQLVRLPADPTLPDAA